MILGEGERRSRETGKAAEGGTGCAPSSRELGACRSGEDWCTPAAGEAGCSPAAGEAETTRFGARGDWLRGGAVVAERGILPNLPCLA
jgi:hypothetical protein